MADVMTTTVVGCTPDATLVEAAAIMDEHGVSALVLVADGRVRGVVTERDILVRCVARGVDLGRALIGDACPRRLLTAPPDMPIDQVLRTLRGDGGDAVVVVDAGWLVGVVRLGQLTQPGPLAPSTAGRSTAHVS